MKIHQQHPKDGGSYRLLEDGTYEELESATGERPCNCRPESMLAKVAEAPTPAASQKDETGESEAPEATYEKPRSRLGRR